MIDKEQFNKFLNPTSISLEEQIDFEIFEHLKGGDHNRVNGHLSRWYGFKEVMNLVRNHEQKNNIKYDIFLTFHQKISPKSVFLPLDCRCCLQTEWQQTCRSLQ